MVAPYEVEPASAASGRHVEVLDFIEQTARFSRLFVELDRDPALSFGRVPREELQKKFIAGMHSSVEVIHNALSGLGDTPLPLSYIDTQKGEAISASAVGCIGYDPETNRWQILLTANGKPAGPDNPAQARFFEPDELIMSYSRTLNRTPETGTST